MNSNQQAVIVQPKANRRATHEEIEKAAVALRSLDGAMASLIETDHAVEFGNDMAVVVTDFEEIPEGACVLLVPPGKYSLPANVLCQVKYIVGLAWRRGDYPVLELQGELTFVTNSDTFEETGLYVAPCSAHLIGVALEATRPSVLQIYLGSEKQFSDVFFNVDWQENVDAYDIANCTALNGRTWLISAYGKSLCRPRPPLEKGLDAFHEGIMNTIDGVFRPLVQVAEKVDRLFGFK